MALHVLTSEQWKKLSAAVSSARREAEAGAIKALQSLAVDTREPFSHMKADARTLRNRLRAHGRQLGDALDQQKGTQELRRLAREVAFEHWHRMLFARFLAENQLLIDPKHGVPISMDEAEELAREQGTDKWTYAARAAQSLLPAIFRADDPSLAVVLPIEAKSPLEKAVTELEPAIFTSSDALGWCYQFWQAERKDEVNAAGNKIGADELPAVTQLFTEDYMVDFLLDNTLGAWRAGKVLAANPKLAESAQSEDELRQAMSLPGCPWKYLRFIQGNNGTWMPAAGTFDGWPKTSKELKCLDPCMGSGHFVVAMFERLVAMRGAEERLDEKATVAAVIRDNLFGLELDPRCTQIGAFNLALAAWRRVGHCALPAMNIACSGLAPNTSEANWLAIAGDDHRLCSGMERLYRLFQKAAVLGSLINPRAGEADLLVAAFHELQPLLEKAMAQEAKDDTAHETAVTARGLAKAAEILAGQFTLVATNVPYLGSGKQDDTLKDYCELFYPNAKADLATCFVERCVGFCAPASTIALVTPQNWWFTKSYKGVRQFVLSQHTVNAAATLGEEAWQAFGDRGPLAGLILITREVPNARSWFVGIDASPRPDIQKKIAELVSGAVAVLSQLQQRQNPGQIITVSGAISGKLLSDHARSFQGIMTGDDDLFCRYVWEIPRITGDWRVLQSNVTASRLTGGMKWVLRWENGGGGLARRQGMTAWGNRGVLVSRMRKLTATRYFGEAFDGSVSALVPKDDGGMLGLWMCCSSSNYQMEVRKIDGRPKVADASLVRVPFDLAHWQKMGAEKYPNGLPTPFSSDPTQWLFNGHPAGADQPLQVAVARLLGYQWPRQTGSSFPDCPALARDGLEECADDDGIVPINAMRGEPRAEDRIVGLLRDAFADTGVVFDQSVLTQLIAATGSTASSLTDWLLDEFFEQHCKLFHHRPFVWHIWDGRRDGFNVLVHYHRLAAPDGGGRKLLEKLTHSYLNDWILRQRQDIAEGKQGAEGRLAAAMRLQQELMKILEGEPPYDLFVRWKPLHEQPIGWDPDINDGVRLNIRPFLLAKDLGKKGAGVLRSKPSGLKWTKDRGGEPECLRPKADFPWFWGCDPEKEPTHATDFSGSREFTGNRWNDLHYSNTVKLAARERHAKRGDA